MAVTIIDEGNKIDMEKTRHILTRQLDVWTEYTCVDLATASEQLDFIAHPAVQTLFDELWIGPLRKGINILEFIAGLLFPPYLMQVDFRKEALENKKTENPVAAVDESGEEGTSGESNRLTNICLLYTSPSPRDS